MSYHSLLERCPKPSQLLCFKHSYPPRSKIPLICIHVLHSIDHGSVLLSLRLSLFSYRTALTARESSSPASYPLTSSQGESLSALCSSPSEAADGGGGSGVEGVDGEALELETLSTLSVTGSSLCEVGGGSGATRDVEIFSTLCSSLSEAVCGDGDDGDILEATSPSSLWSSTALSSSSGEGSLVLPSWLPEDDGGCDALEVTSSSSPWLSTTSSPWQASSVSSSWLPEDDGADET